MDFGYKAEEILWLVESGVLTLGYQSSSYLTDRVPELSFVDLPFLFRDNDHARAAMDGALGRRLVGAIESKCNFRILGWYENGFRHISNRVRTVRMPADLKGIRIRVLPSQIQARTFELLGATPMIMDLTDAIRMIKAGEIDAQENPLTNTVTYGVHKFHRFHTISNHFYISRPIFLHRPTFDAWPADLQAAMQEAVSESVAFQRKLQRAGGGERRGRNQGRRLRDRRTQRRAARCLRRRGAADHRRSTSVARRRAVRTGLECALRGRRRCQVAKMKMRFGLLAAALALAAMTGVAAAGPFEDAEAALARGDYPTALQLFAPLAIQGHTIAQAKLASMYEHGLGVSQNYAEAMKWYRIAADKGFGGAQNNLGVMYVNGLGVPKNYAEAVKWYRLAADQDNGEAEANLGGLYEQGLGVPQDYAKAVVLYRLAADQNFIPAQNNLGSMYATGRGVPQDYVEAERLYRRAAEQGYAIARNNLGVMYATGQGVAKDDVQAHMWFNLSSISGYENAASNRDKIAGRMTPSQIAEAEKLAREWKPEPVPLAIVVRP